MKSSVSRWGTKQSNDAIPHCIGCEERQQDIVQKFANQQTRIGGSVDIRPTLRGDVASDLMTPPRQDVHERLSFIQVNNG